MNWAVISRWALALLPVAAQAVLTMQDQVGHSTLAGTIAGWVLSLVLAKSAHTASAAKATIKNGVDSAPNGWQNEAPPPPGTLG